jgi:hypothetical protein
MTEPPPRTRYEESRIQSHRVLSSIRCVAWAAAALVLCASPPITSAEVIYDVDFSSPTHTLGAEPTSIGSSTTRAPSDQVSWVPFGSPEVVAGVGALDEQPLHFFGGQQLESGPTYEQIKLVAGTGAPAYHVGFDLVVDHLSFDRGAQFTIYLDTPLSSSISLRPEAPPPAPGLDPLPSRIEAFGEAFASSSLGSFLEGTLYHFSFNLDFEEGNMSAYMNGMLIDQNSWTPIPGDDILDDLQSLRFNLIEYPGELGPASSVAIDNLLIVGAPEPGSIVLLGAGLIGLAMKERRRPRSRSHRPLARA